MPPPSNDDDVVNFLNKNFERLYNSNRAPFFVLTDPAWFAKYPGYSEQGMIFIGRAAFFIFVTHRQ